MFFLEHSVYLSNTLVCTNNSSVSVWNIRTCLPSSVRNAPSLTTFRRELSEDCTFPVVVRQWLGDRDCTAQYNCCLPATTDCRRFCCFCLLFFLILYGAPAMSLTWWVCNALLKRYALTEEGYKQRFYDSKAERGESPQQFIVRLDSY